jgi:hypothetical protein
LASAKVTTKSFILFGEHGCQGLGELKKFSPLVDFFFTCIPNKNRLLQILKNSLVLPSISYCVHKSSDYKRQFKISVRITSSFFLVFFVVDIESIKYWFCSLLLHFIVFLFPFFFSYHYYYFSGYLYLL